MSTRRRSVLVWLPLLVVLIEFTVYAVLTSAAARAGVVQAREDLPLGAVIVAASIVMTSTGCFIVWRRPGNVIGWLFALIPTGFWLKGMTDGVVFYAHFARDGAVPGGVVAAWMSAWDYVPAIGTLGTFVLLLFPDGRLPSRRWRPVAVLAVAGMVLAVFGSAFAPGPLESFPDIANPFGAPGVLGSIAEVAGAGFALLPLSFLLSALSLVFRARGGSAVLKEQVRWLAFAGALLAVGFALSIVNGFDLVGAILVFVPIGALPIACAVAIMRYRLFEIDRIISRTVSYVLFTAVLGVVYAIVVVVPSSLLGGRRTPDVLVAIGTLAAALLARPALRTIRNIVDHRFDRRRYDTAHTIEGFSGRLRDEIDVDTLRAELLDVVDRALRPSSATLWLRRTS